MNFKFEQVGYIAVGLEDGKIVALHQYAGATVQEVFGKVADVARREGFVGTGSERMAELGWVMREIYAMKMADV